MGNLLMFGIEIAASDEHGPGEVHAALKLLRPSHLHLSLGDADDTVNRAGIGALRAAAKARLRLDLSVADSPQARVALDAQEAVESAWGAREHRRLPL